MPRRNEPTYRQVKKASKEVASNATDEQTIGDLVDEVIELLIEAGYLDDDQLDVILQVMQMAKQLLEWYLQKE